MNLWTSIRVLVTLGLRNLASHRVKTLIVGSIMVFGTMLVVVGTSLLDSVEASMQRVITSSLAGHLQVHSDKGRDDLALFGGLTASQPDIGEISDFAKLRAELEALPNVKAVVPQGLLIATGSNGNDIDRTLGKLRDAVRTNDAARIATLREQVRQIAKLIQGETKVESEISSDATKMQATQEVVEMVLSDAFWASFDQDAEAAMLELDSKFAPLANDGRRFFVRALGTNPTQFQKNFDRFKIKMGQMIPEGKRGLLMSQRNYDRFLKHRIARQLDRIKKKVDDEGKVIDDDDVLQGDVRRMARQHRRILYQLEPAEAKALEAMLRVELPEVQGDLEALVVAFLTMNTANFHARYDYFYKNVAPLIDLYRVEIGEIVTLSSFTRRGYIKPMNVKLWGTFEFEGLETSDLAGVVNVMDMLTWRELYGQMNSDQREELKEIRAEVQVQDISRDTAEDAMFAGDDDLTVEESDTDGFDEFANVEVKNKKERLEALVAQTFTRETLEDGLALNAAVILKDPRKIRQTQRAIESLSVERGLGLKVVDWQQAAGLVGQLVIVIRVVLYIAIFIIFAVALVIINNSMIMATMERVSEIGTMRAIGAKRAFVLFMFLFETFVLGALAGAVGALLGAGIVLAMGHWGLPATNDILRFIFAGPRLHPDVGWWNIGFATAIIFAVSVISTLYPALVATRIQPVVAMRGRD